MGHEHEPAGVVHSLRGSFQAVAEVVAGAGHRSAVLQGYAPILRRRGRLDVIGRGQGELVEPLQNALVAVRIEHLQCLSATGRHEEEHGPLDDAPLAEHHGHALKLVHVLRADGRVDLKRQPLGGRVLHAGPGACERPFEAAEGVVHLGIARVDAEGHPAYSGLCRLRHAGARGKRSGGRGERDAQTALGCVAGELEQVAAHQGVAAGEHQDRPGPEAGELIDQPHAFVGVELERIAARLRLGTAVLARVCARLRELPRDRER